MGFIVQNACRNNGLGLFWECMKKILGVLILTAVALIAFADNPFAKDEPNTVKIGVILPLTGNMAQVGQPQLAAIELFKKECEKGNYKHKYKVIVEDGALTGRMMAEAAMKLITVDHVSGIVDFSSSCGNIVFPRARDTSTPQLCLSSDPKTADGKFNFNHWTITETEAYTFVDLVQKLGAKRVAILAMRHQGSMALVNLIEPELKKRGVEVVYSEYFNPGERDFRTTLLKIRETKPDFLIPVAFSPEAEIILRQRKQIGLDVKISTIECFDFLDYPADAEGLFYISGASGTPEFDQRLFAATGKHSVYAIPYTYDCLNIIRSAYESMDKPDHAAAAKWISQMKDFPSALGTISMRPDGRIESPASLFRIVKGKPTRASWDDVK